MAEDRLKTIFDSDASSLKVIGTTSGVSTISNTATDSKVTTYAHGYGSDNLLVFGYGVVYFSTTPTDRRGYAMPYPDATGVPILYAEWDNTNVYITYTNNGNFGLSGTVTAEWTIVVMLP